MILILLILWFFIDQFFLFDFYLNKITFVYIFIGFFIIKIFNINQNIIYYWIFIGFVYFFIIEEFFLIYERLLFF